jgi:hypothetical protein
MLPIVTNRRGAPVQCTGVSAGQRPPRAPTTRTREMIPSTAASHMKRLISEPLVQFALLGALVFGLYALVGGSDGEARLIRIDDGVARGLGAEFEASTGRPPNGDELAGLVEGWVIGEVLFREGLALGLDRDDPLIRRRVIEKMRALLRDNVDPAVPTEAELRAWFDARRAEYGEPRRFDLLQAPLPGMDGAGANHLLARLAAGAKPEDLDLRTRPIRDRSRRQLRSIFGAAFVDELDRLEPGRWGLLNSTRGLHAVRVDAATGGGEPDFHQVRAAVLDDWRRARVLELIARHARGLRASYRVVETRQ